jgi:hypothetical protein
VAPKELTQVISIEIQIESCVANESIQTSEVGPIWAPSMKKMGLILGSSDPNNQQGCGTKAGLVVTDNAL